MIFVLPLFAVCLAAQTNWLKANVVQQFDVDGGHSWKDLEKLQECKPDGSRRAEADLDDDDSHWLDGSSFEIPRNIGDDDSFDGLHLRVAAEAKQDNESLFFFCVCVFYFFKKKSRAQYLEKG